MIKKIINFKFDKITIYILLIIFIITEIIDFLLDYWLGNSLMHSLLQLLLFLFLFLLVSKIFIYYSNKKIKKIIPEELMAILRNVNDAKNKGVMINQRKMGESLHITKPTLKKRINALLELKYIDFEEVGNHRYFILTNHGESFFN